VAGAAVDLIDLAVTGVEAVVAALAVQCVAGRVGLAVRAGVDVLGRQRPQVVVAVAAPRRVDALVGEDAVVARAAVLGVVADPAAVVSGAAEDAVGIRAGAGIGHVALELVVARAANDQVAVLQAADHVVARAAEQPVVARAADDVIVARPAAHAVVARAAVD